MFRIGEFSRIAQVSGRLLRFYDVATGQMEVVVPPKAVESSVIAAEAGR